ncbi:MAG: DNA-binding response regulator [Flavobacteriaceae bacterium]|nr:DNA-binding response regulator [Flavobacteriaceae bacterium]|tara:strand:- start:1115 stop:1741 length:627 start_codon:yes stop_codon:yes gene_type:complete
MVKLALIEDDILIQESLKDYFSTQSDIELVSISASVELFLKSYSYLEYKPDCFLLDINLLGVSGIDGIPMLLEKLPDADIIMLTTFEDNDSIFSALSAGACSYLSKKTPLAQIGETVRVVHNGGSYMSPSIARKIAKSFAPKRNKPQLLTPRQMDIVTGIVDGKSYKMIADDLFVSLDTVRTHIKNIYKTLNINSKAQLIKKSFNNEL